MGKRYNKAMSKHDARKLDKTPFSVSEDVALLDHPEAFSESKISSGKGTQIHVPPHLRPVKELQEEYAKGNLKHSSMVDGQNYGYSEDGLPISGDDLAKIGSDHLKHGTSYKVSGGISKDADVTTKNVYSYYTPPENAIGSVAPRVPRNRANDKSRRPRV